MREPGASSVRELMDSGALVPWFQPLGNLLDASVMGYESLIRGPEDTPFHRPDALFAAAEAEGLTLELEMHCVAVAVRQFVRFGSAGKLTLNMSPQAVLAAAEGGKYPDLLALSRRFGLLPSRMILELTENQRVGHITPLRDCLAPLRKAGVAVALDDFGDGHSSLRLWTELRPDMVKIDKHFVRDLHTDNDKFEAVRMLKQIAETFGGTLIAEGIESEADLTVLRDMAVGFGQGFLLGRPQPEPAPALPQAVVDKLKARRIAVFPEIKQSLRKEVTAATLVIDAPSVSPDTSTEVLVRVFRARPKLHAVAVVEDGKPVGLVNRQVFMDRYAQPYHRELYGRRSCTLYMNDAPLLLERDTPLLNLVDVLRGEDQRYLVDGFIICHEGRYVGLGTGERLVRGVSELRIEAARHANPLTALPGNIPISEHIGRLLASDSEFAACYCDLNHFKPFNDYYGYWRGDEVIRLVAGLLVANCDPLCDFVGHVGGDDFVVLMQSEDWEARCLHIIEEFNARAAAMYDDDAHARGGIDSEDRQGNPCFFPFTSLSIGAVQVVGGDFRRHEDVATAAAYAKRMAKHQGGGFVRCDRNSPGLAAFLAKDTLPLSSAQNEPTFIVNS